VARRRSQRGIDDGQRRTVTLRRRNHVDRRPILTPIALLPFTLRWLSWWNKPALGKIARNTVPTVE
jgi:hypothetical protein